MIKSYTDLEQSRKLAEILPLESADMEYLAIKESGALIGVVPFVKDDTEVEDSAYSHIYDRIACWSLAALLELITKVQKDELLFNLTYDFILNKWTMNIEADNWKNDVGLYNNPIDACVAMIEKLHKLNLL